MNHQLLIDSLIERAFLEDIGDGDHTSLACIPSNIKGKANLIVKQEGIIAGIDLAGYIFEKLDPNVEFIPLTFDGAKVEKGQIAFTVVSGVHELLKAERLVLNIMQRMSGIATTTRKYADCLEGLKTKVLDTRKTAPGIRVLDKAAVKLGGGVNHRMGLFDMILIKDNHIDFAGGIKNAIHQTLEYLKKNNKDLKIEIEARSIADVKEILSIGNVQRIMLDNFDTALTKEAVKIINGKVETESSGNITIENIRDYAECGVDYISVGALTHQVKSLDLSLKAA